MPEHVVVVVVDIDSVSSFALITTTTLVKCHGLWITYCIISHQFINECMCRLAKEQMNSDEYDWMVQQTMTLRAMENVRPRNSFLISPF